MCGQDRSARSSEVGEWLSGRHVGTTVSRYNGITTTPRRATITDVARLAGVSIKTVSRVFNREPHVRPSTREKVVSAAETLSYQPNLSARQLASNRTFLVGMLYDNPDPKNENDYVTVVQSGSLQACRDHGYHLLISPCRKDSPELIREVTGLSKHVDGFIVLQPLSDLPGLNQLLLENDIPCVRVSQRPFAGFPWISVGDVDAADDMTEYLLQLGHRRIGFIVGHPEHGQSHDRLAGYRRALERHDIDFDNDLVEQGRFDYESGLFVRAELAVVNPAADGHLRQQRPHGHGRALGRPRDGVRRSSASSRLRVSTIRRWPGTRGLLSQPCASRSRKLRGSRQRN